MISSKLNNDTVVQDLSPSDFVLQDRLANQEIQQLNLLKQKISQFVGKHTGQTITLLTSGGTSVPLQKNAVRFIQNFSTGLRGSQLAEVILEQEMPLIYFYRQKSFLPYQHGITANQAILSSSPEELDQLISARQKLITRRDQLLLIPFNSIYMYLNGILEIKKSLPQKSIIILCAAVSDFIPKDLPIHKITTSHQLNLQLGNSPKILAKMTHQKILSVSFKLQTDPEKLDHRIQFALAKYQVDMVVGNLLGNKKWVRIQFNQSRFPSKQPIQHQENVEQHIWKEIIQSHKQLFEK